MHVALQGPVHRAKELEHRFSPKRRIKKDDQLAIPHVADAPRELTKEEREARQLDLDRLYVGMTRAKERLCLIADESPCPEIERARNLMD